MLQVILSYLAISIISFLQGYSFVPQYTYFYAALSYLFMQKPHSKDGKHAVSSLNFICELVSLAITLALLVLVYHLYFELIFVPQHINKVWLALFVIGFGVFRIKQEMEFSEKRSKEPVYVDFGRLDQQGRVKLDAFWTLRDLERYLIKLEEGVQLNVYGPVKKGKKTERTLYTSGTIQKGERQNEWVVRIDWEQELQKSRTNTNDIEEGSKAQA